MGVLENYAIKAELPEVLQKAAASLFKAIANRLGYGHCLSQHTTNETIFIMQGIPDTAMLRIEAEYNAAIAKMAQSFVNEISNV